MRGAGAQWPPGPLVHSYSTPACDRSAVEEQAVATEQSHKAQYGQVAVYTCTHIHMDSHIQYGTLTLTLSHTYCICMYCTQSHVNRHTPTQTHPHTACYPLSDLIQVLNEDSCSFLQLIPSQSGGQTGEVI